MTCYLEGKTSHLGIPFYLPGGMKRLKRGQRFLEKVIYDMLTCSWTTCRLLLYPFGGLLCCIIVVHLDVDLQSIEDVGRMPS